MRANAKDILAAGSLPAEDPGLMPSLLSDGLPGCPARVRSRGLELTSIPGSSCELPFTTQDSRAVLQMGIRSIIGVVYMMTPSTASMFSGLTRKYQKC